MAVSLLLTASVSAESLEKSAHACAYLISCDGDNAILAMCFLLTQDVEQLH